MKKVVSIVLAVLFVLSCFSAVSFAAEKTNNYYSTEIPTVYIVGQGGYMYEKDENGKSVQYFPVEIEDGYIGDQCKELIAPLLKGIATDDWDEYCDKLVEAINGVLAPVGLDNNGDPKPNQNLFGVSARDLKDKDGRYPLRGEEEGAYATYSFAYDWRLDPIYTAGRLKEYIDNVKAATHQDKVNLVGRCLGGDIALTYLKLYGNKSIDKTILFSTGIEEFEVIGALFSGQFSFDADALSRFADNLLVSEDYRNMPLLDLVDIVVRLMNQANKLGMPMSMIETFWGKIYQNVLPRVLIASYGSFPSFWAFVSDEYFDDAKDFIFGGKEEEYAALIKKIDNYHETIKPYKKDIIRDAEAAGNDVSIIAKYGLQMAPIIKDPEIMGDGILETVSSTAGATCSTITGILSEDYLAAAKEKGTDKYISLDKKIDASTGILPDNTWYIKNLPHMDFNAPLGGLLEAILNFDGDMTVFDDASLPQYLYYDENAFTLTVLTQENTATNETWNNTKGQNRIIFVIRLLKVLFMYLPKLFAKIKSL